MTEDKMKEFIESLSKKYDIPLSKMHDIVYEVADRVEMDLPLNCKEQIELDLGSTVENERLRESGLFPIP
jgi:hypothetical protein